MLMSKNVNNDGSKDSPIYRMRKKIALFLFGGFWLFVLVVFSFHEYCPRCHLISRFNRLPGLPANWWTGWQFASTSCRSHSDQGIPSYHYSFTCVVDQNISCDMLSTSSVKFLSLILFKGS